MEYYAYSFTLKPQNSDAADLLSAFLAEAGFETFDTSDDGILTAYVQQQLCDEEGVVQACAMLKDTMEVEATYERQTPQQKDWNETWEKESFRPISIAGKVCIHAPGQEAGSAEYDILIDPRMAFGTGSHATTSMLIGLLLQADLDGKRVIDAGCGTGVLGILCLMRGASHLFAYDIDSWSVENTLRNLSLNHLEAEVAEGDAGVTGGQSGYDMILANINRNILIAEVPRFLPSLKDGGQLIVSGFYTDDAPVLVENFASLGLKPALQTEKDGWCAIIFEKTFG